MKLILKKAQIPAGWLIIIPIANIYLIYKYCKDFATKLKKYSNAILRFVLYILSGIIMPATVQSELNKLTIVE